jgi:hypothetical protein
MEEINREIGLAAMLHGMNGSEGHTATTQLEKEKLHDDEHKTRVAEV